MGVVTLTADGRDLSVKASGHSYILDITRLQIPLLPVSRAYNEASSDTYGSRERRRPAKELWCGFRKTGAHDVDVDF